MSFSVFFWSEKISGWLCVAEYCLSCSASSLVCVCVCVCVCVRERERETDRQTDRQRQREKTKSESKKKRETQSLITLTITHQGHKWCSVPFRRQWQVSLNPLHHSLPHLCNGQLSLSPRPTRSHVDPTKPASLSVPGQLLLGQGSGNGRMETCEFGGMRYGCGTN